MNLLGTETVLWTVPAPQWARRKVKELETMSERRQADREAIIATLPLLRQYRLTFSSATIREEALRSHYLATVSDWFEKEYGLAPWAYNRWYFDTQVRKNDSDIDFPGATEMTQERINAAYLALLDIGNWATVIVCLRQVETRQVRMDVEQDDTPWSVTAVPNDWKEFQCFLDTFPRPLFRQATRIVDDLNPGVWSTQLDDDSKNYGGVNVRG